MAWGVEVGVAVADGGLPLATGRFPDGARSSLPCARPRGRVESTGDGFEAMLPVTSGRCVADPRAGWAPWVRWHQGRRPRVRSGYPRAPPVPWVWSAGLAVRAGGGRRNTPHNGARESRFI